MTRILSQSPTWCWWAFLVMTMDLGGGRTAGYVEALVSLKTSTVLPNASPAQVHSLLATTENWPQIVLSSWSVAPSSKNNENNKKTTFPSALSQSFQAPPPPPSISRPLQPGEEIDEIFGLPPVLPLVVSWKCLVSSSPHTLEVFSTEGVPGLAKNCRMRFDISSCSSSSNNNNDDDSDTRANQSDASTRVDLTMEYQPTNLLGTLAIPVLTLDNAVALQVLLPRLWRQQQQQPQQQDPLNEFQTLMGGLYGGAGLAHLYDCLVGDSLLLKAAGAPVFAEMTASGQTLALLWCAAGPIALVLSRIGQGTAGLVLYGLVEVTCAALVQHYYNYNTIYNDSSMATMNPLMNAIGVQVAVWAAFLYAANKERETS